MWGSVIDRDTDQMTVTWNEGVPFNSGFFAGEALGYYEGWPDFSTIIE